MIEKIIEKYRAKGILIDSNLLLLLYIGSLDRKLISVFKRTKVYTIEDYDLLNAFVGSFSKIITTPNILTEVSNLANSLPEAQRTVFYMNFAQSLALLQEEFHGSKHAANTPFFKHYGLTDSSILCIVKGHYLLLTDDFRLSQYAGHQGVDVINFNHIRVLNW